MEATAAFVNSSCGTLAAAALQPCSEGRRSGGFAIFMSLVAKKSRLVSDLRRSGWIGDVIYRPYSGTEPIVTREGIRAVSLFELEDLIALVHKPNKHVVLVAGPCGICNETKGAALLPLLREAGLKLWTHVLMDLTTAQSLLPQGT